MLNRPDPLVTRAIDVFHQINHEAMSAGEGIRRIRRLFEHEDSARAQCQMTEVIAELRPVLDMLANAHRGTLQFEPPEPLPKLEIDRLRIQHVLFALVQNAFDASAGGSNKPVVEITVSGDRYAVETSVIDAGSGVSTEIQEQLFRPFFTTKTQGTGLGLASSRAIIEAHEGTIGFENRPGGGSRFWFRLPYADRERSMRG